MYLEVEQMTREKMLWLPSKGYFHQVEQTCSHTNTKNLENFFSNKLRTNMMAADASAASDYFLFGTKVLAVVVAQVLEP